MPDSNCHRCLTWLRPSRCYLAFLIAACAGLLALTWWYTARSGHVAPVGLDRLSRTKPPARPRVLVRDFGFVRPSAQLSHRFTITNNSARTWSVREIVRTCGCISGELSPSRIPPSESSTLELALRAPDENTDLFKHITVQFNEADAPEVRLVIRAKVRDALSSEPRQLYLGRLRPTQAAEASIELRSFLPEEARIVRLEAPDWLTVTHDPPLNDPTGDGVRQVWTLDVRADTRHLLPGHAREDLVIGITTATNEIQTLTVPVAADIVGPVEVRPAQFFFTTVLGSSAHSRVVIDVTPDAGPVQKERIDISHDLEDELEVRITELRSSHTFVLTAEFHPESSGIQKGVVIVDPHVEGVGPVRIDVFARVL